MENKEKFKIGIYDSGLGGLFMLKEIRTHMREYSYVFLADEKNLPYGTKTSEELLEYAKKCLTYLFQKELCKVVLIACNTLSTTVFHELKKWASEIFPDRIILDMVQPTLDSINPDQEFVVFGTPRTIKSDVYQKGLIKKYSDAVVVGIEVPLLASMIEQKKDSLEYLKDTAGKIVETKGSILLCCTHYGIIKELFCKLFPDAHIIYSQEVSITEYFSHYITTSEFRGSLIKDRSLKILLSKENKIFEEYSKEWFKDISVPITILE